MRKKAPDGWIGRAKPGNDNFYNNPYRKPRFYSGLNAKVSEQTQLHANERGQTEGLYS